MPLQILLLVFKLDIGWLHPFASCMDENIHCSWIYASIIRLAGITSLKEHNYRASCHISHNDIGVHNNSAAYAQLMMPICDISAMCSLITVNAGLLTDLHIKCFPDVKNWMIR